MTGDVTKKENAPDHMLAVAKALDAAKNSLSDLALQCRAEHDDKSVPELIGFIQRINNIQVDFAAKHYPALPKGAEPGESGDKGKDA